MEILVDESGSFVSKNAKAESWCVIAAYSTPETEKRKYTSVLRSLKLAQKVSTRDEIKLGQLSEENYIQFLKDLSKLKGALFAVATDSSLNTEERVREHQANQTQSITKNIPKMKHEGGKEGLRLLARQLQTLPVQLYVQLICQIQLIHSFVVRGIAYYVQRQPNSLRNFRWRIDQKNPDKKIDFEDAFEKFCPAILQTLSLKEPAHALDWCDYSPMSEYIYDDGDIPEYLVKEFPHLEGESGFDVQKIVRKDIRFIDSKSSCGVQIADLLASGLRRTLRCEFEKNMLIAKLLGKLMIQDSHNSPPIGLFTLGEGGKFDSSSYGAINLMRSSCKPMLRKR